MRLFLPEALDRSDETSVAVLMTSFNRRELTVRCARQVAGQVTPAWLVGALIIADDGSTDGTFEAVRAALPSVDMCSTGGDAFWSRGMAMAQKRALERSDPDFLLWLNDDVDLNDGAIANAVALAQNDANGRTVVVGATIEPWSGEVSYSGFRRVGDRPLQVERITTIKGNPQADTFNGNFVLVPRVVYRAIGTVDEGFEHSLGDVDYGYRVVEAGFCIRVLETPVGTCSRNPTTGTWQDATLPRRQRFGLLLARKGIPPRSQMRFLRRHAGPSWLTQFVAGYFRRAAVILSGRGVSPQLPDSGGLGSG